MRNGGQLIKKIYQSMVGAKYKFKAGSLKFVYDKYMKNLREMANTLF